MSISFEERLFIAGEFVEGSGEKWDVVNPANKEKIASVHVAGQKEVDAAVDAAEKAWPAWANGDPGDRVKVLTKIADLIEENTQRLATIQSMEMGKPVNEAIGDCQYIATIFRFFAGMADKVVGKTSLNVPAFMSLEIRQPYGVTAGIIPWNSPMTTLAWKIAPALATGNASIIKTSEKSPLGALLFASLAKQAGQVIIQTVPNGILSILSGARETGELLSSHMRIRKIAFTGSAITGRAIVQAAAQSNLKSVTLELGGKSPVVIFEDCDLEDTLTRVTNGFTRNAGQMCIAGSRIYVQDTLFDEFSKRLKEKVNELKIGDPINEQGIVAGPQVDSLQYKRVLDYLEIGKKEGKLLTGGVAGDEKGYYIRPTVFTEVKDDAKINREEIFGPVTILHKFSSEEEVLKRANETEYGLAAYVFTKDISRAMRFAKGLEAGQVGVNTMGMSDPNLGFGGWKGSGLGRELGEHAIQAYTEVKTIFIR